MRTDAHHLADTYDAEERAAIMEYDGGLPRATAERLAGIRSTQPASVQHRADMPPSRVTCGDCAEFAPDAINPVQGGGACSMTSNGMPPHASRGYGVCYPMAPRQCPDFKEL